MKKPNLLISWVFGIVFSIICLGSYIGSAFVPGWTGFILRIIIIVLISGILTGCLFHIIKSLRWAIEEDNGSKGNERRYR